MLRDGRERCEAAAFINPSGYGHVFRWPRTTCSQVRKRPPHRVREGRP